MKTRSERARELFRSGYNCCQSVIGAYADELGISFETCMLLSSAFGGGMGRLREVCGTVSAMFMILGLKEGYTLPEDKETKRKNYETAQNLANKFKAENGSIICRELLGKGKGSDTPIPSERTAEYYSTRPCERLVGYAAGLIEEYLSNGASIFDSDVQKSK